MKSIGCFLSLCLMTALVYAEPLIEAKVGYFFFTDSKASQVFNQGGLDLQLSGSYPLYKLFHLYGNVGYLQKSGHSLNGNQKTSLWEVPLSLGLQPIFCLAKNIRYYVTLGPRYFFVHVHNDSTFVPSEMEAKGLGGFANTGILWRLWQCVTVGLFGEYSYKRLFFVSSMPETQSESMQVGGLTFGGEIGYTF